MEMAFDEVKKELFDRMHSAVRQQLFEDNLKQTKNANEANGGGRTLPPSERNVREARPTG